MGSRRRARLPDVATGAESRLPPQARGVEGRCVTDVDRGGARRARGRRAQAGGPAGGTMKLTGFKALNFDCHGTLIDWETGLLAVLAPWARDRGLGSARRSSSRPSAPPRRGPRPSTLPTCTRRC